VLVKECDFILNWFVVGVSGVEVGKINLPIWIAK